MINKELLYDKRKDQQIIKLLFIGCKGSGISTIFKQLRRIHGEGFTDKHRLQYKSIIHQQCILQIKAIIQSYNHDYSNNNKLLDAIQCIENIKEYQYTLDNESIVSSIKCLWNEASIKQIFENRNKSNIKLQDSLQYFLDEIDRISKMDYIPTDRDIIFINNETKRIEELTFNIRGNTFCCINVCGHKSSWRKWIYSFEIVTGLIFVASLSCYDSIIYENGLELLVYRYVNSIVMNIHIPHDLLQLIATFCGPQIIGNQMDDQLKFFENVINHHTFIHNGIVLFLNKKDLFAEKIQSSPITICSLFNDYDGDIYSYHDCIEYIREKFVSLNHNPKYKQIYSHITCATDRDNIEMVFTDVTYIFVCSSLQSGGLI